MTQDWQSQYKPPVATCWTGRDDGPGAWRVFQRLRCVDLRDGLPHIDEALGFALIGFCCDEGVRRNLGRVGAAQGPAAIRRQFAGMPLPADQIGQLFDVGDIYCAEGDLEAAQAALADCVALLCAQGCIPLVIGGGHETAWGHYQGLAKAKTQLELGIFNFDAHFDLRDLLADGLGSSGTPFNQIALAREQHDLPFNYWCYGVQRSANTQALFARAEALGVTYTLADAAVDFTPAPLQSWLAQREALYLSICLDVFAQAVAPGVSAPQACGLLPTQVLPVLNCLLASGKLCALDLVELAPCFDQDFATARLAATLLTQVLWQQTNC